MAVPMFKERLNNMASQIHLFISDHHTTSANTFPPDLFQGMLSPFFWLPMFKNRDVMLVFPVTIYPKISIQSPIPKNYATSVSVKHILSALSDVLSHHHMPPSSFSTLITAPAPILQSFLQLLLPPHEASVSARLHFYLLSQGPLSLSNLDTSSERSIYPWATHLSLTKTCPSELQTPIKAFLIQETFPDLTSLQ